LIDEHLSSYSLDALAKRYLKAEKVSDIYAELADRFGGPATRNAQIKNLQHAPAEIVAPYAETDTLLAYRLWEWQEAEIERQGLQQIDDLERRAFVPICDMEYRGIRVDIDRAERSLKAMDKKVSAMRKRLKLLIGDTNPNSPKQLTEFFAPYQEKGKWWVERKSKKYRIKATDTGAPSWGRETLNDLPFEEAKLLLDLKSSLRTKDTFLAGHILGHQYKGRVYPSINQTRGDFGGTTVGRLSYTGPALQQIPNRNKEVAKLVRSIFLPEPGDGWIYGDLDQHEYRVMVHFSKSKPLIRAYEADPDLDVHGHVAELMGVPRNVPADGGANAKTLNLAIAFCMSEGRVAKILGLPYTEETSNGFTRLVPGEEALAVLHKYHTAFPGVKPLQAKIKAVAKSRGYIKSLFGRRIRFPRGKGVYKAPASLFQVSSGDLNKDNLVRAYDVLKAHGKGKLLLNIHDEYSISIARKDVGVIKDVQAAIQDRDLRVPIRIDFNPPAKNWWLATQSK
jgi:DNA polymerase I-like protein with 3'-5' exonuclease and polymerase domains